MKTAATLTIACAILCCQPVKAQNYIGPMQTGESKTHFDLSNPSNYSHGTVNVGIALSEGLVLAADSRVTLMTQATFPGYMVVSDNNSKVFAIGNFGVSTYGLAFLQNRTIASWVADYDAKQSHKEDDVNSFASRFSSYIGKLYDDDPTTKEKPILGFLIGGYNSHGDGKLLVLEFPTIREPKEVKNTKTTQGAQWTGDTETIMRLVKGTDPKMGLWPIWNTLTDNQKTEVGKDFDGLEYAIPWNTLMLQDGVDFALSMVRVTVTFQRFSYGTVANAGSIPTVGGAVDILVVRPSGTEWVKRKVLIAE